LKHYFIKILIAGDGGVGKTSLLRRYVDDMYDESTIMTVGVDFFFKQVDIQDLGIFSLQMWDLGGQQRFRSLLQNYVMGARASLLLIDLTRPLNINGILEWVNILRNQDINLPIVLVGTKFDFKDIDEDLIMVAEEDAMNLRDTFNMIDFIKTSSKSGFNIDHVFERLFRMLTDKKD